MMYRKLPVFLFLLGFFLSCNVWEAKAQLQAENTQVVDVTPSSFSVIWQVSETAYPVIRVFSDPAGSTEITDNLEVRPFPLIAGDPLISLEYEQDENRSAFRALIQGNGLMKIRVEGLQPSTTYYFQVISIGSQETIVWPTSGLSQVTTPGQTGFVAEANQMLISVQHSNPYGWLLVVGSPETTYGVSSFVGDGAGSSKAFINLANLFAAGNSNWQPAGVQQLEVTVYGTWGILFSQTINVTYSGNFAVAGLSMSDIALDSQLALQILEPSTKSYSTGDPVMLSWEDSAAGVDANISLYYDTDQVGEDGTLIVDTLREDPENLGDTFYWDIAGINDGTYYIYGTISDGIASFTSYSAGFLTVDSLQPDTDGDQMSDVWENLYFMTLARDGTQDFDSDGNPDNNEFKDRTHPGIPDARLRLQAGMNLVSVPLSFEPPLNASDIIMQLGPKLQKISRLDPQTQKIDELAYNGGSPQGIDFPIMPGAGYYFQLDERIEKVLEGNAALESIDLYPGANLVGFIAPNNISAHQLLQTIGDATVVASIQHYERETGIFETVAYYNSSPVGPDFQIIRGEGYIIHMKDTVMNFNL